MNYFPQPHSKSKINVDLYLSNYIAKSYLKSDSHLPKNLFLFNSMKSL